MLQVGDVAQVREAGVGCRHAEHLGVGSFLVSHAEHADGPAPDEAAGKGRFLYQDQRVERIGVFAEAVFDEAVVGRVLGGGEQGAVESDPTGLAVHLGLLLVVLVTAASVHDTVAGRQVVDELAAGRPEIVKAWVDSGYKQSVIDRGTRYNIDVEVVVKESGQRGFKPQPKRWAIERTFGWLILHRRLARDHETNPERSRTMTHWAMIDNMSRRLTGESTQTWRDGLINTVIVTQA